MRGCSFSGIFFVLLDSARRLTSFYDTKYGQFFATGSISVISALFMWPFEVVKNLTQAETKDVGNNNRERMRYIYRNEGLAGFWRGIMPGAHCIFIRNGVGMIVMLET